MKVFALLKCFIKSEQEVMLLIKIQLVLRLFFNTILSESSVYKLFIFYPLLKNYCRAQCVKKQVYNFIKLSVVIMSFWFNMLKVEIVISYFLNVPFFTFNKFLCFIYIVNFEYNLKSNYFPQLSRFVNYSLLKQCFSKCAPVRTQ